MAEASKADVATDAAAGGGEARCGGAHSMAHGDRKSG